MTMREATEAKAAVWRLRREDSRVKRRRYWDSTRLGPFKLEVRNSETVSEGEVIPTIRIRQKVGKRATMRTTKCMMLRNGRGGGGGVCGGGTTEYVDILRCRRMRWPVKYNAMVVKLLVEARAYI